MRARLHLVQGVAAEIPGGVCAVPDRLEFLRLLAGHSGAEVALYSGGRASLVRKTAGTPAGNERLLRQSAHQRALISAGLRLPRILREGTDDQCRAYFEMEYVPARSLATLLCEAAPFDRMAVLEAVERTLRFFRLCEGAALPETLFHEKLDLIAVRVPQAAPLAARLAGCDWSAIPASLGHGDMTLENILLPPSRGLVFIDCDDEFASSWWLDAAKLRQDTAGHWCMRALYRDAAGSAAWLNAVQRLEQMDMAILALIANLEPALLPYLPQLTALQLMRALPYTADSKLRAFILNRANLVLGAMP